jgi:hypothetical protein
MTAPTTKRQHLPAAVFLVALVLLTALVWWRVITHDKSEHAAADGDCPSTSTTTTKPSTLPPPSSVTLTVLNSTDRNGLAGKVVTQLKKDGFTIPENASNDPSGKPIAGVAEIRYGAAGADGATLLSYYVPGATLVSTDSVDDTVVLSLGLKYKALTPPKDVTAKLAADGVKLVKPADAETDSPDCTTSTASAG